MKTFQKIFHPIVHCLVRNVTPRQFKQVTLNQERGHDLFVFISFLLEPSRESAGPADHFQNMWGQASVGVISNL